MLMCAARGALVGVSIVTVLLAAGVPGLAWAQETPGKARRIVTLEAGGGNDNVARLLARGMALDGSGRVLVENRGGASGVVAVETVIKAAPDGLTLLSISGSLWTLPLMQTVPYDPVQDLVAVALAVSSPNLLVVNPALPVRTVRQLITLARARPGALNYSTAGAGSSGHLSAELFKAMAGVDIVRVAYKGGAAAMTDLISGQVQISFTSTGSAGAHVRSGRLRALALTSAKPSALFPGVPSIATEGLPGYELISTYGVFAPAKTPASIVERLNQDVVRALSAAEIRERFFAAGAEVVASSSQEFAAVIRSDMQRLGKMIREARIRSD
jgi:tripartite-type tricarboxylate transporter receptor subunit TctC